MEIKFKQDEEDELADFYESWKKQFSDPNILKNANTQDPNIIIFNENENNVNKNTPRSLTGSEVYDLFLGSVAEEYGVSAQQLKDMLKNYKE